jgi:MFS family permease
VLNRVGPRFWLPTLLTGCGVIIVCSGLQSSYGGWTAFRVILGLIEAGIFPGCSFILTSWYSPKELHTRMTVFYSAASIAGAFSGLLAYGLGYLDGTWGYRGWRWIYVVEGLLAVVVGLASFFWISPTPGRVKGWLTEEEKEFLLLRHKYSAGGETGVKEKEEFSWADVKKAFRSIHTYAVALIEFTVATVVYGISFVLPTIVESLGYSNVKAQAMTAPPYVFACLVTILSGWAADRYRQRTLSIMLPNAMAVVGFVIIIASVRYPNVPGVTYFGIFLMAGGLYPISPAVMAWVALNMAGHTKRAAGIGLMISISQLGGVSFFL